MEKELKFNKKSRKKLLKGVNQLVNAVKVTMGPKGRNVLIERYQQNPLLTKDGVSVAREVHLKDPVENMGCQVIKEVSNNTADDAGDGTTTATVLSAAIFRRGLKHVNNGANPVQLKRGMEIARDMILESLKTNSREVSKDDIYKIALISANGDESVAKLIDEAIDKVGVDGIITMDSSDDNKDSLKVVEGMNFDRGVISTHFLCGKEDIEIENCLIMVTSERIALLRSIIPVLEEVHKAQKPILIICESLEGEALSSLIVNKRNGELESCAVKVPGFGDAKIDNINDIALVVGANVISDENGIKLNEACLDDLGFAKRIHVTKDDCTIVGSKGDAHLIEELKESLKDDLKTAEGYDKDIIKQRLGRLQGGVAVIKIGASTETELKERKDRIEDALCATRAASESGIVIGGGCALLKTQKDISTKTFTGDEKIGMDIIKKAIEEPFKQILKNAGIYEKHILDKVLEGDNDIGVDAINNKLVNMFDNGVIDPLKVEIIALTNAISAAGMLLTTECTISISREALIDPTQL